MIELRVAHTLEMDDAEAALSELMEQIGPIDPSGGQALGLATFHPDFIETGVAQAVCAQLPFDVIGCSTIAGRTSACGEMLMLSLTVFTGEDVAFTTAWTSDAVSSPQAAVRALWAQATAGRTERPRLAIPLLPLSGDTSPEALLRLLDDVAGGTPMFGTVACDYTADFSVCSTLFGGEASHTGLALGLLWGDVQPAFALATISPEQVAQYPAIITRSDGSLLYEVNGMPLPQYLQSVGIGGENDFDGTTAVPFLVDRHDGLRPVARTIYAIAPQGYAVCGGDMPVGAGISVGSISTGDILKTTDDALAGALGTGKRAGMLMFSCGTRYMVPAPDVGAEMDLVHTRIGGGMPYRIDYGGGEICPVPDGLGGVVNRYHNYTFTACIF